MRGKKSVAIDMYGIRDDFAVSKKGFLLLAPIPSFLQSKIRKGSKNSIIFSDRNFPTFGGRASGMVYSTNNTVGTRLELVINDDPHDFFVRINK